MEHYVVGDIARFVNEDEYTDFGGRKKMETIPHFTSWKVKLIRAIPLKYHKVPGRD
jgi:hypothetical protein